MRDLHAALRPLAQALARRVADGCFIALAAALWLGGILLAALGAVLLVLLLIADGDPDLFFLHLSNLATRYLAADAPARLSFLCQGAGLYLGIVALLLVARAPLFLRRLRHDLEQGRGR